jgi:hypothetical protein
MTKAAELAKMGEVLTNSQIGGRRNIIINSKMEVAQRGTSFTSVSGSAYHLDRFRTGMGDTTARFTVTQATAGLNGFGNSLKYDCTTAESSLSNAFNCRDNLYRWHIFYVLVFSHRQYSCKQ